MYAKLLEKVQLLYNDCLEKIAAVIAQVKAVIAVAAAVAKIQLTMLERRVRLHAMSIVNKLQAKQQEIVGRMKARYHALRSTWRRNQHFTFWFIPADGQNIAKTHVKKTHLKYALTAVASFLVLYLVLSVYWLILLCKTSSRSRSLLLISRLNPSRSRLSDNYA